MAFHALICEISMGSVSKAVHMGTRHLHAYNTDAMRIYKELNTGLWQNDKAQEANFHEKR